VHIDPEIMTMNEIHHLTLYAMPVLVLMAGIEVWLLSRRGGSGYAWKESAASIAVAAGHFIVGAATAGIASAIFLFMWSHRITTIPATSWWGAVLLFFAIEFVYYWYHRLAHEQRWLWASHSVHHSPRQLNLSAAYRLGWTGQIIGTTLFFAPLALLGFHPVLISGMLALDLLYQFWLHTELVPSLGRFERIFNSPSLHRVHHASNEVYLDRNFGGVLIIFDRLFGTYTPERADEPCHYGVLGAEPTNNPVSIALREWVALGRDLMSSQSLAEVRGYVFGPPGWRPDRSVTA
jgi:sterol desaturase/sphingolipid hydroxylase (fatty acid hydroxylase superfamily)